MTVGDFLAPSPTQPESWPTGFSALDVVTGGFRRGEVWVITGSPAVGKSVLMTQLAYSLAVIHGFAVEYHCGRVDPPDLTRARLLSLAVRRAPELPSLKVPLDKLDEKRRAALDALTASRLDVFTGGGFRIPPWEDAEITRRCLAVDDPEGKQALALANSGRNGLRRLADGGTLVLTSVPRSHCLEPLADGGSLREEWSSVADMIIEIVLDNDFGDGRLVLRQNRRGPTRDVAVTAQTHWARFVERASS